MFEVQCSVAPKNFGLLGLIDIVVVAMQDNSIP